MLQRVDEICKAIITRVDRIEKKDHNQSMKDIAHLKTLDKHHIFDAVDAQPAHLRLNFADSMTDDITPDWGEGLENVVVAGMGGSALAADIAKNWLSSRLARPLEIVRGYDVPEYVGPNTLFVASSYSGNTEETLSAIEQAQKRSARIVVMAAGGKLLEIARAKRYFTLELPQVSQPRLSVFAGLKALTCVFSDLGWIGDLDVRRELLDAANWLDVEKSKLSLDNLEEDNLALTLARHMHGAPAVVYAGPSLRAAAYKWKIDINENAKQLAFCNVYPELNHNEYQGWLFPEKKPMKSVQLQSSLDNERVQKRFEITREILDSHGFEPIVVNAEGRTHIQQLLWTILLGDYVSAYMGILNGIDPTPVALVEELKKKLG
jgi:glucose/mannose-6-phosphate isomerase